MQQRCKVCGEVVVMRYLRDGRYLLCDVHQVEVVVSSGVVVSGWEPHRNTCPGDRVKR